METSELLQEALELIRDPDRWCQRKMFVDDDDGVVTQYCSVGAIRAISRQHVSGVTAMKPWVDIGDVVEREVILADVALTYAATQLLGRPFRCAAEVNDGLTHPEVMVVWKQAIANTEQER